MVASATETVPEKRSSFIAQVNNAEARGKVALQLGDSGLMTLSSLGDVQVFEAKAASETEKWAAVIKRGNLVLG